MNHSPSCRTTTEELLQRLLDSMPATEAVAVLKKLTDERVKEVGACVKIIWLLEKIKMTVYLLRIYVMIV